MAFVVEKITTDAQRAELASLHIESPFSAVQTPHLEAFGETKASGSFAPTSKDVVWKTTSIGVPAQLESRKKVLASVLKDALEAHGYLGEEGLRDR